MSFKIKSRYFELVTAVTTKLLESTKKKIIKDKNGENVHCMCRISPL